MAALANVSIAIKRKNEPVLSDSIELIIASVGASGGLKICGLVLGGELNAALKHSSISFAEDDQLFIFLGCFAPIWVSVAAIIRRLK